MADLAKHLVILGLALPIGVGGYHLAGTVIARGRDGGPGTAEAADLSSGRGAYRLSALPILEQDLYKLESRYVERDRLDPDAMFTAALDRLERQVPEVMFQREPQGRRLHVSVGDHSEVLDVGELRSLDDMAATLRRVAVVLDQHLPAEVARPEVEYTLVNGALSTLDPHTVLLPPEAASDMDVDNKGEFGGLGIEITVEDGRLTIKQPIADTPASRAGLKAQDQIVRIDDEATINMDLNDAVSKLRGRKGEPVTIMVMRKGFSEPRPFTIVRDTIKLNPVEGELLEGNVGYVRIKSFHQGVGSELEDQIARFKREAGGPLRGLVLDLRSNPGGYLTEAVEVSDKFLADGVIVSTVDGATGRREEERASRAGTTADFPVAVLVNGNSASASEIVAGALRNQDRGVVIGERTFGKGSVQHLFDHDDGSRLKLTVSKYLTPGDRSIQAVGIPPDIELVPALVEPPAAGDDDDNPLISLYWREWVDREADLDNVLRSAAQGDQGPTWSLRYLRPREEGDSVQPQRDWEVQLAREVLLAARGSRRPDVLAAAGRIVEARAIQEQGRIVDAFRTVGLDWRPGPQPAAPDLSVALDLGPDGVLAAGQAEDIGLLVTNNGTEAVHQLSVSSASENPFLDHREFYLGYLAPGATARAQARVKLQDGYPTELSPFQLELRTPDAGVLARQELTVPTQGRPLPRLRYSVQLFDDGSGTSRGDGDGLPEAGEVIDLELVVENVGEGPTSEAFARIKNRSGRALDLSNGSIEVGAPVDAAGRPCVPLSEGCGRVLAPGASYTDRMSFTLREAPADGAWSLDLQVGDNRAYDFATVQRAGFYEYFQLKESLSLRVGQPPEVGLRQPPTISVTRAPPDETGARAVVVSGMASDDKGLRDLMIFHGEDKVFYQGGGHGETTLPFSVERNLLPGANLLVVLARDEQGLTSTQAITVWYEEPEAQAQGAAERSSG
ncbi:S41 family peptidase [Myxococcota bacterium]|nr:S41 family peptidase [Myxococcota bacterium]